MDRKIAAAVHADVGGRSAVERGLVGDPGHQRAERGDVGLAGGGDGAVGDERATQEVEERRGARDGGVARPDDGNLARLVRRVVDGQQRLGEGTYVRTLAADLGTLLGGGAHLRALRRRAIGSFTEADACPSTPSWCWPPVDALRDYRGVAVDDGAADMVRHGRVLDRFDGDGPWAVVDARITARRVRAAPGDLAMSDFVQVSAGIASTVVQRDHRPGRAAVAERTVLTIGAYDGVHRGHRRSSKRCDARCWRGCPLGGDDLRPASGVGRAP